jgi:TolB-like protein
MASIIPGYEYDIFISYRQKDNKYDGWVTEFVDNLTKEIEATFKEDISIYFDINPHDGLLETHDVDASLKDKLKCLVFIPIFSRTYCDPKSFAWEREFKAFIDQASKDQFGLKVKLPNGNVANRIIQVQIHDLYPEDKATIEKELGGVLRAIEFIYKEPGVNRPLTAKDNEDRNKNKTNYRNQINKVANAIDEIIHSLKGRQPTPIERKLYPDQTYHDTEEDRSKDLSGAAIINQKSNKWLIALLSLVLCIVGAFAIFKIIEGRKQGNDIAKLEKSIAVLPFLNYSIEPDQEAMSEGLTDEIIDHLSKIKSFDKVVSLRNVLTYKGSNKNILQIANELQVNYILDGTYKKIGDQVKIRATLIEPKDDNRLWQDEYDRPYKELINIQADISLQIADKLDAFLSNSELQDIQKIPTTNQEAYELMQKALYFTRAGGAYSSQISDLALKAIKLDPSYADAYALTGIMTLQNGTFAGSKGMSSSAWDALPFFDKALELDPNNSLAHFGMGNIYEWGRWDYISAEKEYLKVFDDGSNKLGKNWNVNLVVEFFLKMNRLENASIFLKRVQDMNFEYRDLLIRINALSDSKKEAYNLMKSNISESGENFIDNLVGEDYIWIEEYDSAKIYLESAMRSKKPSMLIPRFQADLALAYFKTNNIQKAGTILSQLEKESSEAMGGSPEYFIGWYYSGIGEVDSAFLWLEKAFNKKSPEFPWLKIDPVFKNLKEDPRYWDLYARTGHKAYDDYITGMKHK